MTELSKLPTGGPGSIWHREPYSCVWHMGSPYEITLRRCAWSHAYGQSTGTLWVFGHGIAKTNFQWVDILCIPESDCSWLCVPLFLHFSFSPVFKHVKIFVTFFSVTVRRRKLKLTVMILKFSDIQAWTNSADPDQTASKEQSDQGLHCL